MVAQNWVCSSCGHVVVDSFPPDKCPACGKMGSFSSQSIEAAIPTDKIRAIIDVCLKIVYGLYVVTSIDGEKSNGQICNTLFQVTSEPPRIAIAINKKNLTHEYIEKSGLFAASILGVNDHKMVRRFGYRSGREFDKLKGVRVKKGENGCPLLEDSVGYLEASIVPSLTADVGTHSIFIGDILCGGLLSGGEPITYAQFRENKSRP